MRAKIACAGDFAVAASGRAARRSQSNAPAPLYRETNRRLDDRTSRSTGHMAHEYVWTDHRGAGRNLVCRRQGVAQWIATTTRRFVVVSAPCQTAQSAAAPPHSL